MKKLLKGGRWVNFECVKLIVSTASDGNLVVPPGPAREGGGEAAEAWLARRPAPAPDSRKWDYENEALPATSNWWDINARRMTRVSFFEH